MRGIFARLAWAVLAVVVALGLVQVMSGAGTAAAERPVLADGVNSGDAALYRDIARAVAQGESYYAAAARLHRERSYPLRPFVTVRSPVLAWATALIGPVGLLAPALALIAANALLWYRTLADEPIAVRLGVLALLSAFGAGGLSPEVIMMHEWWSGLLLSAALAAGLQGRFAAQLALAVAASLIRELSAAFLLLMLAHAAWLRRKPEVFLTAAALAALAAGFALHAAQVATVVKAGDIASQGWLGLRGPAGFAGDVAMLTGLDRFGPMIAFLAAMAPLAGWLAWPRGGYAAMWVLAFALGIMAAGRADNFYWAQLILPAYLAGWVLLARALADRFAPRLRKNAGTNARPAK